MTQANSHVGSSTGTTTIVAGDTTTLAGAQVLGNQVNIDTNKLNIESRQDTAKYDSKQMDMSGQVTVGYGFSASGSYSQNKINADYASVNEQSGILAGDGGYHVNVKNHTDLKGGIITSTQAAEDAGNNYFGTGTLTASNIQNHADYDASGFGVSGGFGVNGKGEQGNWAPQGANTNGVVAANQQGKAGTTVNKSVGYASDSDSNASTTVSGINTANLTITNTAGQAQLLGKPADTPDASVASAVKQSIATSTTTTEVQANSGAIANNFDKNAVQSEIDTQVAVTQQFDVTRQQAKTIVNQQIDDLNKIINDPTKSQAEKNAAKNERDNWQIGGSIVDSIASGLSGPSSTGAAGILANAAAPQLQYQIGQYFKGTDAEGSTAHILAHTILAAATAAAGGNDALMAGLAAGGAEAVAPAVANWLYGSNPDVKKDAKDNVIASELTAEQKNTLSNIIGLGTAGATGLAGGSVTDVVSSTGLAQTAVEDNTLVKDKNNRGWIYSQKQGSAQYELNQRCTGKNNNSDCDAVLKELFKNMTENPASPSDAELKGSTLFLDKQNKDINRLTELKNECGANTNCHATFASMIQFAKYELENVYNPTTGFQAHAIAGQAQRIYQQTFDSCSSNGGSSALCSTLSSMAESGWGGVSSKGGKSGATAVGVKAQPKGDASKNRAENITKGLPESVLGPSGKPKIHTPTAPTQKRAKDQAQNASSKGKSPEKHVNPTVGDPHYHPSGNNERIHYGYPQKGYPKNKKR